MVDFNGTYTTSEELLLDKFSGLFKSSYSVVEFILFNKSKPLFVEDHYLKVMSKMRILRIVIPMSFTPDYFHQVLSAYCEQLNAKQGVIKLSIFENSENEVQYLLESTSQAAVKEVELELYNDFYLQEGNLSFVNNNFLVFNELVSRYAQDLDTQGCFILNNQKRVIGTNLGSVFFVSGRTVTTPELSSGCQDLVSRKKMIEWIATSNTFQIEEKSDSPFAIPKNDLVFTYSFEKGLHLVSNYRKKTFENLEKDFFIELVAKNTSI